MRDEQRIVDQFRRMDSTRKQQALLIFDALANEFPDGATAMQTPPHKAPPMLSLVSPLVVREGFGKAAENDKRGSLLRLATRTVKT